MTIRTIGPSLDRTAVDNINLNFSDLARMPGDVIKDLLSYNNGNLPFDRNSMPLPTSGANNTLNDYGMAFESQVNGIIHRIQVRTNAAGKIAIGIAEQQPGYVAGAILHIKEIDVISGIQTLVLDFPIEQGKSYNLFKRNLEGSAIGFRLQTVQGWQTNTGQWQGNSLSMLGGMFLSATGTNANLVFFNVDIVTNIAQIYKLMNESVKLPQQFYVGNTPPGDAQFWFRPVGGG